MEKGGRPRPSTTFENKVFWIAFSDRGDEIACSAWDRATREGEPFNEKYETALHKSGGGVASAVDGRVGHEADRAEVDCGRDRRQKRSCARRLGGVAGRAHDGNEGHDASWGEPTVNASGSWRNQGHDKGGERGASAAERAGPTALCHGP